MPIPPLVPDPALVPVFGHGSPVFGQAKGFFAHALPQSVGAVPLTMILAGLLAAFLAVNAWGTKRAAARIGEPVPPVEHRPMRPLGGRGDAVGLVILVVTVALSAAGPVDPSTNLTDVAVLTLGWGFVALTSMLIGGWWFAFDPAGATSRTLDRLSGGGAGQPRPLPDRVAVVALVALLVGWAHLQLLAFLTPTGFTIIVLLYVAGHVVGTSVYGPAWLQRVEPVTVMSRVLGLMRPGSGGPLQRLSGVADSPTLRWVSGVLIGWSLADLLLETEWWHDLAVSSGTQAWLGPLALLVITLGTGALVTGVSDRVGLGPAFVPVAAGWVLAHYLSILLIEGQGIPIWLSDPFGNGANYLGRAGEYVNAEPLPIWLMSTLQIVPFMAGHVLGVAVAQRRAATRVKTAGQLGPATLFARALIAVLLLGGAWLQLGGL